MAEVEQTAEEMGDSITGHDEMAITQHFGATVAHLMEHDPLMFGRALVFVSKRREADTSDDTARNFALDLPLKAVVGYFTDPAEESEESGKDEPVSEPSPPTSLSSVS